MRQSQIVTLGVIAVLLTLFATTVRSVVAAEEADGAVYDVGLAKVDITPDYPIRLNGFGNRTEESEGVSQRIWARAMAVSYNEGPPLVLVAIDSLGIRISMVDEVAARLSKQFGLPRQNLVVSFSHSHCTPKVIGASDNIFSQPIPRAHQEHITRYTRQLTDSIEKAAALAIRKRHPARMEWGIGRVAFAVNRRTPGGPVDHDLPMLVIRDRDSQTVRGVYASYACHCVTLSFNQISGDWAGYAAQIVERAIPNSVAMISIGCGSDANPNSGVTGGSVHIAAAQGAEIAAEVDRLLNSRLNAISGTPRATLNTISLPLSELPDRDQLRSLADQGGSVGYNAATQLDKLDRGERLLKAIDYPVQTFSFGTSLSIVFLAGEVCVDYSLRLKRELEGKPLWINAYCNDFCCYIPSERLLREGGYGGGSEMPYFALPTTLKPGIEQTIVDEVKRQLPRVDSDRPGPP